MKQEVLVPILKPCPFYGDSPQIVQTGTFVVQCADCGAMGPRAPNMERAAVRWNKRKGDDFGRGAELVEIGSGHLQQADVIASRSEVNALSGWLLGKGLPTIDLAHGDLAGSE